MITKQKCSSTGLLLHGTLLTLFQDQLKLNNFAPWSVDYFTELSVAALHSVEW
jgi:hypothetical protein